MYPNTRFSLTRLLTMPFSVAEGERSISVITSPRRRFRSTLYQESGPDKLSIEASLFNISIFQGCWNILRKWERGQTNCIEAEGWKTNLMSFAILFHFLCAQHVSGINISIVRSLLLCCWITTCCWTPPKTSRTKAPTHNELRTRRRTW